MVTDERKEVLDFSDPLFVIQNAVMVAAVSEPGTQETSSFIQSIADSFEKNFIREDRWKLILDGIVTTMIITVAAVIFGSILAFGICMFRRTGSKLADIISNIYSSSCRVRLWWSC